MTYQVKGLIVISIIIAAVALVALAYAAGRRCGQAEGLVAGLLISEQTDEPVVDDFIAAQREAAARGAQ